PKKQQRLRFRVGKIGAMMKVTASAAVAAVVAVAVIAKTRNRPQRLILFRTKPPMKMRMPKKLGKRLPMLRQARKIAARSVVAVAGADVKTVAMMSRGHARFLILNSSDIPRSCR